jgi:hypothetical protein
MTRYRQVLDAVEMFWNRWVIEYSASQQLLLARQLSREFGWLSPKLSPQAKHQPLSRRQVLYIAAGLAVLVLLFLLRKLPRRQATSQARRRGRRGDPPIFHLYRKTLERLSARGFTRRPEESPHEYLARLRGEDVAAVDVLARLTDCYAGARYGDIEVPDDVVLRLRNEARSIARDTQH